MLVRKVRVTECGSHFGNRPVSHAGRYEVDVELLDSGRGDVCKGSIEQHQNQRRGKGSQTGLETRKLAIALIAWCVSEGQDDHW